MQGGSLFDLIRHRDLHDPEPLFFEFLKVLQRRASSQPAPRGQVDAVCISDQVHYRLTTI